MPYAKVVVDISTSNLDKVFEYECGAEVISCSRVTVPFGNRSIEGYVIDITGEGSFDASKIKPITKVLNSGIIIPELVALGQAMSIKYNIRLIDALRLFLPAALRGSVRKKAKDRRPYKALDDRANALHKLIYITIPQMKNIFILVTISGVTGTVQMFDLPFIMTAGGPVNRTLTPMLYLFNQYRDPNRTLGFTVAGALVIMVFISIINSFIFTIIRSEKSIEG